MEKRHRTRRTRPAADTAQVVGDVAKNIRVPSKWRRHFDRLQALRDHLRRTRGELIEDARQEQPAFSLHMADAGTDTYDRDFALSRISSEQNALYEIEEAMNRIRTGRYGICELTGKSIETARLEAIPWTRFSAAAESRLEREGAVQTAKLGDLERVHKVIDQHQASEEFNPEAGDKHATGT